MSYLLSLLNCLQLTYWFPHLTEIIIFGGCHETPHRLHTGPRNGYILSTETRLFSSHFLSVCHRSFSWRSFSWISWIDRWHTDSQRCSEPRPQTAPAKATGGRQDYHDFKAPLLTMLLVLASQALTVWTRRFDPFFVPDRPIFGAGAVFRDTDFWKPFHIGNGSD